jgi:hypothetical protein
MCGLPLPGLQFCPPVLCQQYLAAYFFINQLFEAVVAAAAAVVQWSVLMRTPTGAC